VDIWWTKNGPHYGAVLVMLMITFCFLAAAPHESWTDPVRVALAGTTLLIALSTTPQIHKRLIWISRVVVLVALVSSFAAVSASMDASTGTSALLTAMLVAVVPPVIAIGVKDQPIVTLQSVWGAVCIYILLGLFFAVVYGAIGAIGSGSFFASGVPGTSNEFLYFSFVTMTTTGYGDFTAATDLGRTLAVTEALLGQLYIVTVLALIVTRFSGAVRRRER
jgi:ion channel